MKRSKVILVMTSVFLTVVGVFASKQQLRTGQFYYTFNGCTAACLFVVGYTEAIRGNQLKVKTCSEHSPLFKAFLSTDGNGNCQTPLYSGQ